MFLIHGHFDCPVETSQQHISGERPLIISYTKQSTSVFLQDVNIHVCVFNYCTFFNNQLQYFVDVHNLFTLNVVRHFVNKMFFFPLSIYCSNKKKTAMAINVMAFH